MTKYEAAVARSSGSDSSSQVSWHAGRAGVSKTIKGRLIVPNQPLITPEWK